MFVRGITVFCAKGTLARVNTHFPRSSAHLRSRPGIAPTFRTSVSPEVHTPSATGFRDPPPPPEGRHGFREIPYATTVSSLWSYGVSAPKYPARAGVPFRI